MKQSIGQWGNPLNRAGPCAWLCSLDNELQAHRTQHSIPAGGVRPSPQAPHGHRRRRGLAAQDRSGV